MPVPIIAAPINAAIKASKNKSGLAHQVFEPTKGLSDRYQTLSDANPYANVNYKQSWWQKFLSGLGFRTNYDSYLEGMNLQAQEYDSAVLQKQADEAYNDPSAQVARLRAAGINPDLSGNVSPGESSALQDDGNPPVPPQADDLQQVTGFAGAILHGVQSAFTLASGVVDLRNKKLSNITTEDALISDALMNILPSQSDEPLNYNQLYSALKNAYGGHIKKRYFPDFVNRAYAFMNGLNASDKEYKLRDSRVGSRKDFYFKSSGSDYSEENQVMAVIANELSDLALATSKKSQAASQAASDATIARSGNDVRYENEVRPEIMANELEYQQGINPSQMASNEMATSNLDLQALRNEVDYSNYQKLLRGSFHSILKKLDGLEESGNWFAPYAKAFISAFLLGQLPSINISRSQKFSPKSGSSSNWSFGVK